jgi:CelD/BcsL family acetyltransferase involved in cellulose biosynthesis
MVSAEIVRPSELAPADREAWAAFCAATPMLRSPLLGPDFAEAVARRRPDAFVAVMRRAGRTVGFLPHHRRPSGLARPIGAPFSDYHALVCEPGMRLDGREALAAAGLKALRFTHLIDPLRSFDTVVQSREDGYLIKPGPAGVEVYLEAIRAANPKRAKNWRRLEHKLEREAGPIAFCADDRDRDAFETLIRWKRQQLTRTGLHDVFGPDWSLSLMRDLFEQREGAFQGLMITLRAGDRLVAGHFGARLGGVFHSWVSAVDPAAASLGPGNTLLLHAIGAMPALELDQFDMGPCHGHYKEAFCTGRVSTGAGAVSSAGAYGPVAQSAQSALALAASRSDAVARLLRRMDHIAATELSIGGRVRGLVRAFATQGRRVRADGDRVPN